MEKVPDIAGWDGYEPDPSKKQRLVAQTMALHIMQQIVAENPYHPDMEWQLWWEANDLEEQNALPDNVTAFDVYQAYLRVWDGE